MAEDLYSGKQSTEVIEYLLRRRSTPLKMMDERGPSQQELDTILKAAMRVPDHGRLFPWYFIVFQGDTRKEAGEILKKAWLAEEPDAAPAKLELEAERFMRAPTVIAVVSRIRAGKHPQWEQILSAGAVCQNLSLAANALGYGVNWLTEWYSYSDVFKQEIGLDENDNFAGFVYIGAPKEQPEERDRPTPDDIVTHWKQGAPLNKGENYGYPDMGTPRKGFSSPSE